MLLMPRKDFDLFDEVFKEPFFNLNESKVMKTDIKETDNGFSLVIDLPGYDKDNIKMHIEEGYLIVSAKTSSKIDDEDKDGVFVRKERYYGECSRSFYVGEHLTEEDIKATFKNGTLKVEIPKKEIKKETPEKKYITID